MIKVNEYFDGGVKSLGYDTTEGKSTVGVMEAGEYEFGTTSAETMIIIEGKVEVLLPGKQDWQLFAKGQIFEVPANASFKVKSLGQSSYLCKYRDV